MRAGMMRASRRWWRRIGGLGLTGVLLVNGLAWSHAWRMTHYAAPGPQATTIEALSSREKVRAALLGVAVPRPENRLSPGNLGLAYETVELSIGGGERIAAWSVAQAQPRGIVALFPAYASSRESLLAPARTFHELGYAVLLVDFRGVGDSSGTRTTLGISEAEDVTQVADYARRTWPGQPLVLYGVSMGGAAVLRAVAVGGVSADALILESPFDRFTNTVGNRFRAFGLPAEPGTSLLTLWGSAQVGANGFAHNPAEYARAVACPTLILHGEQDPRVTVTQVAALRDGFTPGATLVLIPGAGHEPLIGVAPTRWRGAVSRFMSSIPAHP